MLFKQTGGSSSYDRFTCIVGLLSSVMSSRLARPDTKQWILQVLLGTEVEGLLAAENPKLLQVREGLEGAYLAVRAASAAKRLRVAQLSLSRMRLSLI